MTDSFNSAGLQRIDISLADSNGYLTGLATTHAQDSVVSLNKLDGVNDFSYVSPDDNVVTVLGDDIALGSYNFEPTELANGDLVSGILDLDVSALLAGVNKVDDSGGQYVVTGPEDLVTRDVWLAITSRAKSYDSANFGASGYHITFAKVNLRQPERDGWSHQSEGNFTYSMVAVPFSKTPWGTLMTDVTEGTTTGKHSITGFYDAKRMVDIWKSDNVATSFNLSQSPTASLTAARAYQIDVTDGSHTELTIVSGAPSGATELQIDDSTGLCTLFATIPADDLISVAYNWE